MLVNFLAYTIGIPILAGILCVFIPEEQKYILVWENEGQGGRGTILDKDGNILDSGIIIEGLRPKIVANKIHPGKFKDLSQQFGFKGKVHSRHLSAIAASYIFKGTTVFTVSEENDSFHVFENGRIVYSL